MPQQLPLPRDWGLTSPSHHEQPSPGTQPLPVLPMLDIPLIGTPPIWCSPVRFIINPHHRKQDHCPSGTPDNQPGKRAYAETSEANVSNGHKTPQVNAELPITILETPNDAMVAFGSTGEHGSEDNTDHCGDNSNQDESRKKVANSNLESASGVCLTCLDTEEVAIRTI